MHNNKFAMILAPEKMNLIPNKKPSEIIPEGFFKVLISYKCVSCAFT